MTTTMRWGETIDLLMQVGFPVDEFKLNDATYGQLDGQGVLDGTLVGDDVSAYAQQITVTRGRKDDLSNFDAGVLSVTLRNDDRRFDPTNTSSPYWNPTTNRSGLTPRRRVELICQGVTVFVGRISDIDLEYDPNPSGTSTCVITAVDDFSLLSTKFITTATTPTAELSSTRVSTILDRTDVAYSSATRDIETGVVTVGTQQIDANTNALVYLQQVAETEWGLLFCARDGDLTYRRRQTSTFANVQATFNDNGTNLPYQVLQAIYGSEYLYNRIQVEISGGSVQTAEDTASQTEYGVLTYTLDNTLFNASADAATLAAFLLDEYKTPTFWFDEIATPAHLISNANRQTLYALDMGSQVQLTRNFPNGTPTSVTNVYAIERISHLITADGHQVRMGLYNPTIVYQLLLDNATQGKLDSNNALT